MRAALLLSLVVLAPALAPQLALAQSGAPAAAPAAAESTAAAPLPKSRARGADISRDEYIERAVERAKRSAATRFDKLDANHDGILTADERRAARAARRAGSDSQ